MGVTQDFIDAGYQMVNGQLVNPDTLTGQNSSFQYNNPGTGKAPTGPKSDYGLAWEGTESYGDGLRSKDSFENYKQNFRAQYGRDERRWWIGRGGGNGGNSGNRSADTIGLVNLNVGTG